MSSLTPLRQTDSPALLHALLRTPEEEVEVGTSREVQEKRVVDKGKKREIDPGEPISVPGQDAESIHTAESVGITTTEYVVGDTGVNNDRPHRTVEKGKRRQTRNIFGLARRGHSDVAEPDDYEQRYPQDEFGQEMGPSARVWRVYLDEAESNARNMVEGWKDDIDALLVFAGLFSAIVTTFVVQTSQKLDQDFGQVSASLLTELISIQRSVATGALLDEILPSKLNLSSPPLFSNSDAWVNGLWFTSLSLSLSAAFYAILIRHWAQRYATLPSGTPQERARIQHFRYIRIQRWSVPAITSILPALLYAALFLFFIGLVVFLQALMPKIAYVVGFIGGIASMLYATTAALPLLYPQCPYQTPLIEHVQSITSYIISTSRPLIFQLTHRVIPRLIQDWTTNVRRFSWLKEWCEGALDTERPPYELKALPTCEAKAAEQMQDNIMSELIPWLLTSSSNLSVKSITLQSISGLRFGFSQSDELLGKSSFVRKELLNELRTQCTAGLSHFTHGDDDPVLDLESFIGTPIFYATERILRASMFIPEVSLEIPRQTPIPITRRHLREYAKADGQGVSLQQALATYIINHARTLTRRTTLPLESEALPTLSDLHDTAETHPMVWSAWFNGLNGTSSAFRCPDSGLAGVHSWLKPLFNDLLDCGCSAETWGAILPFVGEALPSYLTTGHQDLFKRFPVLTKETVRPNQAKFFAMLLDGVVMESGSWGKGLARLEDIIQDISRDLRGFFPFLGSKVENGRSLLSVLDHLLNQPFFVNAWWRSSTYHSIFLVYLTRLDYFYQHPSTLEPTRLQHLSHILSNWECTFGLVQSLFLRPNPYNGAIDGFINSILAELKSPNAQGGVMVDSLFTAFQSLDWMPSSSASARDPVDIKLQWPADLQPLVRWMIEQIIALHGTNQQPSVQALATQLSERADVLTFVCSSFLIDTRAYHRAVFSKESEILLQLAEQHKSKRGAVNAWHAFLSWVVAGSAHLRAAHNEVSRNDIERYGHMAVFVDHLVNILGLDGSKLKVPPFKPRDPWFPVKHDHEMRVILAV